MAFEHLNPVGLLEDTCSIEPYSASSEDANLNVSDSYGTAATWPCNAIIKPKWNYSATPPMLTSDAEIWLDGACTVTRQARLTHNSIKYRVVDVSDWGGAGKTAYCKRWEQVTG